MEEKKMSLPPQQFCVRWNSYHTNLQTVFPRLLLTEQFADVTLACESRQLRCHKLVLSACSAYLERLLVQNPCKHPIVFMRDMRFSEMQALVDFMYKGEVNVTQSELPSLLKSAEALQIRGLCSGEGAAAATEGHPPGKDYTVATEALLAQAQRDADTVNGAPAQHKSPPTNGGSPPAPKRSKPSPPPPTEPKEEQVEEDGLYYGELDSEHLHYEDEDSGKPGSSLGQSSEFAIANVQCQYDSPSDTDSAAEGEAAVRLRAAARDHTYDRGEEPPAFLIHQLNVGLQPPSSQPSFPGPFVELSPNLVGVPHYLPGAVNVIHLTDGRRVSHPPPSPVPQPGQEINMNKRIRRSEQTLRAAADCVSRGLTFQTVSEKFNIPISTIRFFMARKGILPRRRRGRHGHLVPPSTSPEPPFHMQHYKLPDMLALKQDPDDEPNSNP